MYFATPLKLAKVTEQMISSCIYLFLPQGSGVIKAGFAGDQIPKYCFPN